MYGISKIIRAIPKLKGSKGALSLGAEQIKLMAKDKELAKVIGSLKEPTMDIAYKAKSNYNVAAFKLRDGKNVVANGAVSLQNPGTTESILKYRLNVGENGNVARVNGFMDTGKKLDFEDIAIAGKQKKGIISAEVESGQALRHAARIDKNSAVELAERIQPGSGYGYEGKMLGETANVRTKLADKWSQLAKILSGEAPAVKPLKAVDEAKIAKSAATDASKVSKQGIEEFIVKNKNAMQNVEIGDIKKCNSELRGGLAKLSKEFEGCTDSNLKTKLASEYKEMQQKLERNEKYLEEMLRKNSPEFS